MCGDITEILQLAQARRRYGEIWGDVGGNREMSPGSSIAQAQERAGAVSTHISPYLPISPQAQERAGAVAGLGSANRELAASEVRVRVRARVRARVRVSGLTLALTLILTLGGLPRDARRRQGGAGQPVPTGVPNPNPIPNPNLNTLTLTLTLTLTP